MKAKNLFSKCKVNEGPEFVYQSEELFHSNTIYQEHSAYDENVWKINEPCTEDEQKIPLKRNESIISTYFYIFTLRFVSKHLNTICKRSGFIKALFTFRYAFVLCIIPVRE